jgi:predicted secreted protein
MAYKLGMDAVLKYGTAGTTANTALASVRNVTLNLEKGEADVTTRGNGGWKATVATLKDASVEFEMVWDTADAGFTAIKNSYFNNTAISLLILDAATGGQGLDADFMVTKFTREEPLDEAIVVKVTAKPTLSTRSPTWHTGSTTTIVES